jgi:competence protein ComGC
MPNIQMIKNNKGFTIVEVLAAFLIIVISVVGIYLGLLYAESQLNRNYHERTATLLASGECDWQFHNLLTNKQVSSFITKEVVINPREGTGRLPLKGIMSMRVEEGVDLVFGKSLSYITIIVEVVWNEPLLGERKIVVQEDFFL